MTRLEALEAVAAAARGIEVQDLGPFGVAVVNLGKLRDALAALDQTAPQPPGADPQPRRGSVADTAGIFDGPDSVEWLREQRGVPMIPDLLAKAYGADALVALAALDRLEASTHDASGGPPAPHRRPSEEVGR